MVENLPANVEDMGSIPGPGGSHVLKGSRTHALQLLKPVHLRVCAQQQEKPPEHLS